MYDYEHDYNDARQEAEQNERYYNSALGEVNRLRGVVRQYDYFYNKIKEALENKDWNLIEATLKECE